MNDTLEKIKSQHRCIFDSIELTGCSLNSTSSEGEAFLDKKKIKIDYNYEKTIENNTSLRLKREMTDMAKGLNTLLGIVECQKRVLSLIPESKEVSKISFEIKKIPENDMVETPINKNMITPFSNETNIPDEISTNIKLEKATFSQDKEKMFELNYTKLLHEIDELKQKLVKTEAYRLENEKLIFEREELKMKLDEAENEIDDLKYGYEQKVKILQKELDNYKDIGKQLCEIENDRHLESTFTSEMISKYEGEVMTLKNLLASSTEKEFSLQAEKQFIEENGGTKINLLEDALAAAARMNTVLLENTEKRDLAYYNTLKEMDNLRKKMIEAKDEVSHQKEIYEEKIKLMDYEILFLKPFKERFIEVEKKLLEFSQNEKTIFYYKNELQTLQNALEEANDQVLNLKKECTTLSFELKEMKNVKKYNFTQSENVLRSDVGVNTSESKENYKENNSYIMELKCEIKKLKNECDEWNEKLDILKQSHSIETDFLTEKLLKAESKLQVYQLQNSLPIIREEKSVKCNDVAVQVILDDFDSVTIPKEVSLEKDMNSKIELKPPIIVTLSPREKKSSEVILSSSEECISKPANNLLNNEIEKSDISIVEKSIPRRSQEYLNCKNNLKHEKVNCLWCSNKVNQSMGGSFGSPKAHLNLTIMKQ